MKHISVVEITRPRLNFLNIMQTDNRIKVPGCVKAHCTTCGTTLQFTKFSGCMKVAQCLSTSSPTSMPVSKVFAPKQKRPCPQTKTHKSLEPLHKPLPSRDQPSTSQPTELISVLHLNIRSIKNNLLELETFLCGLESLFKSYALRIHLDDDAHTFNFL